MSAWVEEATMLGQRWVRRLDGGEAIYAGGGYRGGRFYASVGGFCISSAYKSIEAAKVGAERALVRRCTKALADLRVPAVAPEGGKVAAAPAAQNPVQGRVKRDDGLTDHPGAQETASTERKGLIELGWFSEELCNCRIADAGTECPVHHANEQPAMDTDDDDEPDFTSDPDDPTHPGWQP